jgi:hypothetical protein
LKKATLLRRFPLHSKFVPCYAICMTQRAAALPTHKNAFDKKRGSFEAWLLAKGSAIMQPSNPFEVSRFLTDRGIWIVYRNDSGRLTSWLNGADDAYLAFLQAKPWRAVQKVHRGRKTTQTCAALVKRDGAGCVYCNCVLSIDSATVEQLVPIASGGTNHLQNKTLACHQCNGEAGHLSVREKIELAIAKRSKVPA